MNKVVRHQHVMRKGAPSAFALTVLAAALYGLAADATAQYADPGRIGDKASWETDEYHGNWGVDSMKASSAYALGFYGQGVKVGVMDSGSMDTHQEYQSPRFIYVEQEGNYGTSGMRYRGAGWNAANPTGLFFAGDPFSLTGAQDPAFNDSHGTAVTGIVGANRDGVRMHGISWGSDIVVGNTGGNDSNNYGPYQDYNFFYAGWKAMVDAGAEVINNSWGTNIRINTNGNSGYVTPTSPVTARGRDNGNISTMIPTNSVADVEYEYFYWKKMYAGGPSFADAAWDAIKDTPNKVVMIMTTGNRDMANPFHRALYPYFHPEAESQWIAAAGIQRITGDPDGHLRLVTSFNEAGLAKWWTVVGASGGVVTPYISGNPNPRDPAYYTGSFSGTSSSAPHIAGAMGVLLSRYANMDSSQVRDVMFTTATNRNTDGTLFDLWTSDDGVPDERYGWGLPALEKGMYGPGQFLGQLDYNASQAPLDVWSNDISQVALDARAIEEIAWLNDYKARGIAALGEYHLGDTQYGYNSATGEYDIPIPMIVADNDDDPTNHIVDQADAEKWRKEYADARAAAIQAKIDQGLYDGSLIKRGAGTLVMTGDNTYRGGTTVVDGNLFGFTESFGSGRVVVNAGRLGVLESYNDSFTQKGLLRSNNAHLANIQVNNGGTLAITEGNVHVNDLTFNPGSRIGMAAPDRDLAADVYLNGYVATGTLTAETLTGFNNVAVEHYALLNFELTQSGNNLYARLSRDESASFASVATSDNGSAIADVIQGNMSGPIFDALGGYNATEETVRATLDSLGSDLYLNADTSSIINSVTVATGVRQQVLGLAAVRMAKRKGVSQMVAANSNQAIAQALSSSMQVDNTFRLWASANGNWADIDFGNVDLDADAYSVMIGGEYDLTTNNTLGAFIGAGSSKYKGGGNFGKIDSNDFYAGLYGVYTAPVLSVNYGVMYTHQNRDADRTLLVGNLSGNNSLDLSARNLQFFVEGAYTGLNNSEYSIEPYLGLSIMRTKSEGFSENVAGLLFKTEENKQTLETATLGVRGSLPFAAGSVPMAAKGNLSFTHFFGDDRPEAMMDLAGSGRVELTGGELKNIFGAGLGIEAAFTASTKFELSYNGMFNGDIKSHGVFARITVGF